jgi:hypothetical protein
MYFDMFYIQWHHFAKKDLWNKIYMNEQINVNRIVPLKCLQMVKTLRRVIKSDIDIYKCVCVCACNLFPSELGFNIFFPHSCSCIHIADMIFF